MAKKKQRLPEKKSGLKTIHIILALLVISALAIYFLNSGGKGPENLPDDNYKKLNTTIEPGKVKIIEFLNLEDQCIENVQHGFKQVIKKQGEKGDRFFVEKFFSPEKKTETVESFY